MANLRISEEQLRELIYEYQKTKDKKVAVRINCVIAWGKGWDWATIEDILMVSNDFISKTVAKYQKGVSSLTANNYSGNHYKMTAEQEEKVREFVSLNFIPDSQIVIEYIKEQWGVIYSPQGIVKLLKRLGFVYKRPKRIPGKHPDEQTQKVFVEKIEKIMSSCQDSDKESIYFLDGSGFYHNPHPGYGWIKKGQNKFFPTNTSRKKINVNGAYHPLNQEVITIEQEESINQESNIQLVDKIINLHPEVEVFHLVLDNAKYNYGSMLRDYIQKVEKERNITIHLIYLPPYSPNLNLIERLWKYAKKILLSSYYEKFSSFASNVIDFFERLIKEDFHKLKLKHFIGRKFQIIEG